MLFFEEFAKIVVRGASLVLAGALLGSVISVYDFLAGFAAGNARRRAKRVGELQGLIGTEPVPAGVHGQKLVHRVGEFVRVPLRMVEADFIGITDCYAVYVWLLQKVQHDAETL